jgi:hypothetical protein
MTRVLAAVALLLLMHGAAKALAPICQPTGVLLSILSDNFNEGQISGGPTNPSDDTPAGTWIAIFSSPDRSTWSLVVIYPSGVACLIAAGKHWRGKEWRPKGAPA